jgi:hypothetical protein
VLAAVPAWADGPPTAIPGQILHVDARAPDGDATVLTIDVVSVDIRALLMAIANEAGVNVVLADGVEGKVTVQLRKVHVDAALTWTAAAGGYGLQSQGNLHTVNNRTRPPFPSCSTISPMWFEPLPDILTE